MNGSVNHRGWIVLDSIRSIDGQCCVDVFERPASSGSARKCSKPKPPAGRWTAIGGFAGDNLHRNFFIFFRIGVVVNCLLLLFNLIPVPPLDGHRIVGDFVPSFRRFWESEQGAQIGLFAFLAIFFFGASYIWDAVFFIGDGAIILGLDLIGVAPPI